MSMEAVLTNARSWHVEKCHVLDGLRALPDECANVVVTSPPYWNLRNYGLPPSDWGDGFYRVESALGEFSIEGGDDEAIYRNVSDCCHGDEYDGRIFRDCTWNYDRVYEKADADLLSLLVKLEAT